MHFWIPIFWHAHLGKIYILTDSKSIQPCDILQAVQCLVLDQSPFWKKKQEVHELSIKNIALNLNSSIKYVSALF